MISLSWFSKKLKNDLWKNNWLRGVILILLVHKSIFVGWGFPFPILPVPRYKLSLCHTPIKPDLLGFSASGIFVCGLLDRVFKRFASHVVLQKLGIIKVQNKDVELVLTHVKSSWRMCLVYRKLNLTTHKDRFLLPFMDQMLKKLASKSYYFFIDGYRCYNHIVNLFEVQ
jgi:hypothetical protein